jgi:uncharacterized protein YoxC
MSERYWIFQNNQVIGPFSIEELLSRPDFSGDALVCPEGRQGTDAGDWQRASLMPPIQQALSKPKSPLPVLQSQPTLSPEPGGDALLIKELSLLGAVHEKLGALGQSVNQLQESFKEARRELDEFRAKFDGNNQHNEDWSRRIQNLESSLSSLGALKGDIEQISAESRAQWAPLEEATRSQKRLMEELSQKLEMLSQAGQESQNLSAQIADLNTRFQELAEKVNGNSQSSVLSASLDELRAMINGLKDEISEVKLKQESVPAASLDSTMPQSVSPVAAVEPSAGNMGFPPSPFAPPSSMPGASPMVSMGEATSPLPSDPAPDFILPTGNVPDPNLSSSPSPAIDANQPASLGGDSLLGSPISMGAATEPQAETGASDSSSLFESSSEPEVAPAKAPKKSKKGSWLFILIVLGGALFALAYVLGLIPGLEFSKPKPAAPSRPLSSSRSALGLSMPKPAPPAAQSSLPPEQEKAFKDSAIEMVQNWPIPSSGKTISQALGVPRSPLGDLSPWSAEKIKDNLYQVNYQTPPAMNGMQKSYEFQADLSLHQVVGQNQLALDLLSGKSQFQPAQKKRAKKPLKKRSLIKKKVYRAKKKIVSKKPVVKKSQKKKTDIMPGIPNPGSAVGAPAQNGAPIAAPASPASAQPPAAPQAQQSQDQELDQLLKP